MARETIQVNHGEREDGLKETGLRDLQWAQGWMDVLRSSCMDEAEYQQALEYQGDWIERGQDIFSAAERRFFACSPEARELADDYMDGDDIEWEDQPQRARRLADKAEELDTVEGYMSADIEAMGC